MPPSPLLLVGFMGCGKSTAGRRLAQRLGWRFCDLDEKIEAAAGATVAAIFAHQGEAAFRIVERQQLEIALAAADVHPTVLALGGGTFAQPDNCEFILRSSGHAVFLDLPVSTLLNRCAQMTNRPLFRDEASFRQLHAQRLPYYLRAPHRVVADEETPDQVAELILARFERPRAAAEMTAAPELRP